MVEKKKFQVVDREKLTPDLFMLEVEAPLVTRVAKAGQFVIVRLGETGERIPLTIMDSSVEKGTVKLVLQVVGTTTDKLSRLGVGDSVTDVVGPLGRPMEVGDFGRVALVGGGVGIAAIYPMIAALQDVGCEVRTFLGARDKDTLILLEEIEKTGCQVEVATEDGSLGCCGFVTEPLEDALKEWRPDRVVAVGPVPMMKAVADLTRDWSIPTVVSLNCIMVDGTGMCGTCRCEVGGETRFCCVDGPEFDAHQVNFDLLVDRLSVYKEEEKESWERFKAEEGTLD